MSLAVQTPLASTASLPMELPALPAAAAPAPAGDTLFAEVLQALGQALGMAAVPAALAAAQPGDTAPMVQDAEPATEGETDCDTDDGQASVATDMLAAMLPGLIVPGPPPPPPPPLPALASGPAATGKPAQPGLAITATAGIPYAATTTTASTPTATSTPASAPTLPAPATPATTTSAAASDAVAAPRAGQAGPAPEALAPATPQLLPADGGVTTTTTTPVLNLVAATPALWRQPLREALGERLQLQIHHGSEQALIRLDPPMLGRIEILVRHESGQVHVQLSATNAEVARQLQHIGDSLRQDLVQRQHGEVTVTVNDHSRDAAGRERQRQPQPQPQAQNPGRALGGADEAPASFDLLHDRD